MCVLDVGGTTAGGLELVLVLVLFLSLKCFVK